jgi:hypothetical protein
LKANIYGRSEEISGKYGINAIVIFIVILLPYLKILRKPSPDDSLPFRRFATILFLLTKGFVSSQLNSSFSGIIYLQDL